MNALSDRFSTIQVYMLGVSTSPNVVTLMYEDDSK